MTTTTTTTTTTTAALEALNAALWQADLNDDYEAFARIEAAIDALNGVDRLAERLAAAEAKVDAAKTGEEFVAAMREWRNVERAVKAMKELD